MSIHSVGKLAQPNAEAFTSSYLDEKILPTAVASYFGVSLDGLARSVGNGTNTDPTPLVMSPRPGKEFYISLELTGGANGDTREVNVQGLASDGGTILWSQNIVLTKGTSDFGSWYLGPVYAAAIGGGSATSQIMPWPLPSFLFFSIDNGVAPARLLGWSR
jgi:hypothetical protein